MAESEDKKPAAELPARVRQEIGRPDRLEALGSLGLSGPGHDAAFDELVEKAAAIFDAEFAQVSFIDAETQWVKCAAGSKPASFPVDSTFCAHTIAEGESALVVLDTTQDERFAENSFVTGAPEIRFYIGCPIRFRDHKVGTFCVYDSKPRQAITADQKRLLLDLSWDASRIIDKQVD